MRTIALLTAMCVCFGGASPAAARRKPRTTAAHRSQRSPFKLRAGVDGPIIGGALTLWVTTGLLARELPPPACFPCDRASLNGLDRPVTLFKHSATADQVSNGLVVGIPAAAVLAGSLLDLGQWGWRGALEDLLLIGEALALAGMVQEITALAVRRPRPFMYRPDTPERDRDSASAGSSFFSGHTTACFAATSAFATIFTIRRPHSPLRPLVWILSLGVASAMPVLRVASGEHFWSDVLVGAAVGTAFGVLVPSLHRRGHSRTARRVLVGPGPGAGLGVLGQF